MILKLLLTQLIAHKAALGGSMAVMSGLVLTGSALIPSDHTAADTPLAQTTAPVVGGQTLSTHMTKEEIAKQQAAAVAQAQAQQAAVAAKAKAAAAAAAQKAAGASVAPVSIRGSKLYIDPGFAQQGRPAAIASQPIARWFGGWNANPQAEANALVSAASGQGALAQIVAYNIPARDCGSYSAGGANSSASYRAWIRQLAAGIGQRRAIVILEPDALAQLDCLSGPNQASRLADLTDAVDVLTSQTKAYVYLDAGHSNWHSSSTMADRLKQANVGRAQGFALNVSNFQTSDSNIAYGEQLASKTGGKHYVIDTSRNGRGPTADSQWCNPAGRGLGRQPTTSPSGARNDAYLWIKTPGESDGACNGAPAAGAWFEAYAQELIANAVY